MVYLQDLLFNVIKELKGEDTLYTVQLSQQNIQAIIGRKHDTLESINTIDKLVFKLHIHDTNDFELPESFSVQRELDWIPYTKDQDERLKKLREYLDEPIICSATLGMPRCQHIDEEKEQVLLRERLMHAFSQRTSLPLNRGVRQEDDAQREYVTIAYNPHSY